MARATIVKSVFFIRLVFFAGVAQAATLAQYNLAVSGTSTATATATADSNTDLTLSVPVVTRVGETGNDYKVWGDKLVPNINVGNGTGKSWTQEFTLTNTGTSVVLIDSISFELIGVTGGGDAQNSGGGIAAQDGWLGTTDGATNKPIDFTLTWDNSTVTTGTYNLVTTGQTLGYTLTDALELATGESITFSVTAANNPAYTSGCYAGLKQLTVSGDVVPEPATASLSLLGLAALMMRRRRA